MAGWVALEEWKLRLTSAKVEVEVEAELEKKRKKMYLKSNPPEVDPELSIT